MALLGQTDSGSGESRRNENVQLNLIDTATTKELMVRLGATATIQPEFSADRTYFGGEFGARPSAPLHLPAGTGRAWHGLVSFGHLNSVFSAPSFFQAAAVQPARENEPAFSLSGPAWRGAWVAVDLSLQRLRGNVNGNVLVPLLPERTALAADPALRRTAQQMLDAYPLEVPNCPDVDPRALNTNAPQRINTHSAVGRIEQSTARAGLFRVRYQFTSQAIDAFQFVKGQNPDTDTCNHTARLTWSRALPGSATLLEATLGFDRLGSLLRPEPNGPGATANFSNAIAGIGPSPIIPIDRA